MIDGWALVAAHWPELALFGAFLVGIYLCVRTLAMTVDSIGNALGPVGNYWRDRRAISRAEIDDLQRRITYLDGQVRSLRYRDECYFGFTIYDQEYHHRQELLAAQQGWALERHVTFMEYRDRWIRERGLHHEDLDIWQ